MKKKTLLQKAFLLLALIGGASSAWGDPTYTDQASTVTWAFTSHTNLSSTNSPADAFLTTNFSAGSNLNLSSVTRSGKNNCWDKAYDMVAFVPTTTVAKNTGETAANTLTFTITPAVGITFTPTNVSLTGCNYGGTGDPKTNIYVEYSDDSKENLVSSLGMIRDDKGASETQGGSSPSKLSYNLEHAVAGQLVVKIWMDGLTNTSKGVAFTNIVVTGTVSGTPIATTTYTITGSTNNVNLGTVSGTATVAENEEVTLTATPTATGSFVKWQKDGEDFSGNTVNPLTVIATADATYTAIFKQIYSITYNVEAANKGTASTGLGVQYANALDKWTAPQNYYTASEGKTLTAWNDGVNNYVPGTEYTLTENITISPVYTANAKYLSDLTTETTVNWTFARNAGAPTLNSQNNTQYYVQRTTIAENTVDVPMFVNTVNDYGISGKNGKFNNSGNEGYAQVNNGTVFKIPAVQGMVVRYSTNQTSAVANIGFTDDTDDLGGDGTALTHPTVISGDNKTISYTYTGTADYLYLVDINGGKYPTGISVTYPEKKTKYLAPTITVGDFSFADKAYPVTITAVEGTLYVSTDGENYTVQTSPYEVNVTTTTHFYAKATGASYDDSEVVDENVTNTFDGGKRYVAWVYESNYANAPSNYNVANDEIYKALNAIYNVVLVDIKDYKSSITDEQKTALNGNLDDADLVVISEAAAGGSKAVIGLKDIVGTVPMLNMKLYAYSTGRWGWGTPANKGTAAADVTMTPASKFYKVLNGVTFDGNDVALFSYPNEQNHIQYVDSWTDEPSGDVVLATITVSSVAKPVMHASTSQKYFALGLSCDDFTKYNSNAIAIVKNAAAMLIAGEALNTEMATVTATVGANGYTTFASSYPLDLTDANRPAGLKAYKATRDGANLTFTALNQTVPAGTGLLLFGETKGGNYDIPVAASGDAVSSNALVGVIAPTAKQSDPSGNYYFVMKKAASESDALAFAPLSTSAVTIPAGKAYVEVPNSAFSGGANELTISFEEDGDVTGISEMKAMRNVGRETFFDLQGRQVTQPTKGLYIVNGRKVVIK